MANPTPTPAPAMLPTLAALKTTALDSTMPNSSDQLQSPCVSTPSARARFEFENARGNEGTKVLMVEWEDDEETRRITGTWTVSWEGKPPHVLPEEEKAVENFSGDDDSAPSTSDSDASIRQMSHRLYFLLGQRRTVPATVTLTLKPTDVDSKPVVWKTNPLPAIFPPSLVTPANKQGKGVLHSLWAEKRLQKLEREIQEEAQLNCEGIALQMAISEKEWIEKKFGLAKTQLSPLEQKCQDESRSPTSPLSPGGSRLSEKLRGLKLQTIDSQVRQADEEVAVPLCKRKVERIAAASANNATVVSVSPFTAPERSFTSSSMGTPQTASSLQSIGAILAGTPNTVFSNQEEDEKELFALPLSPRSPEMAKSPFSFAAEDIRFYQGAPQVS